MVPARNPKPKASRPPSRKETAASADAAPPAGGVNWFTARARRVFRDGIGHAACQHPPEHEKVVAELDFLAIFPDDWVTASDDLIVTPEHEAFVLRRTGAPPASDTVVVAHIAAAAGQRLAALAAAAGIHCHPAVEVRRLELAAKARRLACGMNHQSVSYSPPAAESRVHTASQPAGGAVPVPPQDHKGTGVDSAP